MNETTVVNSIPRKAALTLIVLMAIGIVPVAKAVANALVDSCFRVLRWWDYDAWITLVHPDTSQGMTDFAVFSNCLEVVISLSMLATAFPLFGLSRRPLLSFGKFHWSIPLIILILPFVPNYLYVFLGRMFALDLFMGPIPGWNGLWRTILVMSIAVPIWEEFAWRGWVISAGKQLGYSDVTILVISSSLFAFMHLPNEIGLLQMIIILPLAFGTGWLRIKTGGIFWPILLHALVNFIPLQSTAFAWYAGDQQNLQRGLSLFGFGAP